MRGKHTLKRLGESIELPAVVAAPTAEKSAHEKKVELMVARYYFYTTQQYAYDKILEKLASEFFLSTGRVADILVSKTEEIKKLRQTQPQKSWFATKWTHLLW